VNSSHSYISSFFYEREIERESSHHSLIKSYHGLIKIKMKF